MDVAEYLESLISERDELQERHKKLNAFLERVRNGDVSENELFCPFRVLNAQADVMREYLGILDERIMIVKCSSR